MKDMPRRIIIIVPVCIVVLLSAACAGGGDDAASKTALRVTVDEFRSLHWVEGHMRGSGGKKPFHEIYTFVNDSTVEIDYYGEDSTFTRSLGKGNVHLANGIIYHEYYEGGVWVADAFDSTSIHFVPLRDAGTTFLWEKGDGGAWSATLWWVNDQGDQVEKTFRMEPVDVK